MGGAITSVERSGETAVVRLRGDLTVAGAGGVYEHLRALAADAELRLVVVDFSQAGRVDSAGAAAVALVGRQLERAGKQLELRALEDRQRAAFDLAAHAGAPALAPRTAHAPEGAIERFGGRVIDAARGGRSLGGLIAETLRRTAAVALRRQRVPQGSIGRQIALMGAGGVFIVALLSCLLGMTVAFQAAVQLQRFGAGVFVADMLGISMVRELAPLMTAVILTGRTGAAIAAELGTMKVRSELDALATMGISPVRYLVVPRFIALTFIGPALTLMGMFVGLLGGLFVSLYSLDMAAAAFMNRLLEAVELGDFVHGICKSFVFAWIIALSGAYLGMNAGTDASSVGSATTRTVVTSVFCIILVDAIFATTSTIVRHA